MINFTLFLRRFIEFAFSSRTNRPPHGSPLFPSTRNVPIDEVNPSPPPIRTDPSDREIKLRLIVQINWLLMGVCAISFISMIIYSLVYPNRAIPDLIQNSFFTTLGWFGGVLATFFKVDQSI
jgi:hypothetical protein